MFQRLFPFECGMLRNCSGHFENPAVHQRLYTSTFDRQGPGNQRYIQLVYTFFIFVVACLWYTGLTFLTCCVLFLYVFRIFLYVLYTYKNIVVYLCITFVYMFLYCSYMVCLSCRANLQTSTFDRRGPGNQRYDQIIILVNGMLVNCVLFVNMFAIQTQTATRVLSCLFSHCVSTA